MKCIYHIYVNMNATSSSTMTEKPRELGNFKGMGHFEA